MHTRSLILATSTILLMLSAVVTQPATAAGRGDGACIISSVAPIYNKAKGDKTIGKAEFGDCLAGITTRGILGPEYTFEEEDGRVHVAYFPKKEQKGLYFTAWMNPEDLSRFTYECGCGSSKKAKEECTPFTGVFSFTYNTCFKEARDKKRAEVLKMASKASGAPVVSEDGGATKRLDKALRNEDVISLVKVGLDDALILSKIQGAETTDFDLSTDGIVALRTAKVSNAVIDAMMKARRK